MFLLISSLCLAANGAGKSVHYRMAANHHRELCDLYYSQAKLLSAVPHRCPQDLWAAIHKHHALATAYDVLTFRPWGSLEGVLAEMQTANPGKKAPG